jgi:hypothetical protein
MADVLSDEELALNLTDKHDSFGRTEVKDDV